MIYNYFISDVDESEIDSVLNGIDSELHSKYYNCGVLRLSTKNRMDPAYLDGLRKKYPVIEMESK